MVGLDPANYALTVSGLVTQKKKNPAQNLFKILPASPLLLTLSAHSLLSFFLTPIDRVSPAYTPYKYCFVIDKKLHRL